MQLLSSIDKSQAEQIFGTVALRRAQIGGRQKFLELGRYFAGHHRSVFDLTKFPELIVKVHRVTDPDDTTDSSMYDTIQKSRQVVQELGLTRCFFPAVEMEKGEDYAVWIEEKLKGIYDAGQAVVVSEKEYLKMKDDPALQQKWMETFLHVAKFIVATGYHDVDWRNLLLMEEGVGFVDFEQVEPTRENVASGLLRLLEIAPPEVIDPILQIVEKEGLQDRLFFYAHQLRGFCYYGLKEEMSYAEKVEILKTMRREQLAIHERLYRRYDEMKLIDPHQPVDSSPYEEGSMERRIIDKFNSFPSCQYSKPESILEIRKLSWQPFIFSNPPITHEEFERGLERLKNDGVVIHYEVDRMSQTQCDSYTIYC